MFARTLLHAPRKLWTAAALAGLLAALLFWHLLESAPRPLPHPPVASITVAESHEGSMPIYVSALGTVAPVYTVSLYSQVTGQVIRVNYHEGQFVHRGDPLVEIDPRPYAATLEQAEGALRRDEGMLAEARMDLARYRAAYARNAVPRQQLQDQEQTVVQDEGTVEADRGAVAYDRVELAYCHIVSPIDGRVGLRLVDPGNTVFSGTGSTLVVITQVKPITVVFDVSEDDLPQVERQLSLGRTLPVEVFDRSDAVLLDSGSLTSLDNEIDTTTGTLRFRAELPNDGLQLFPNQFVNARLQVRTLTNITLVPSSAVQHDGLSAFVYVVRPNHTAGVQPVTVLASDGSESAVRGLPSGATVATSGFNALDNGVLVSIRGLPAPTAPRVAKAS
jgi:membrane fusion protein, multidrug efflux system